MNSAENFRIENIRKARFNGQFVKTFSAFEKQGDAFVFCGHFTAPAFTPNKNLWQHVGKS